MWWGGEAHRKTIVPREGPASLLCTKRRFNPWIKVKWLCLFYPSDRSWWQAGWGWSGTRFFTRPFFLSLSIGVAVIGLFCPEGAGKKGQFNELMWVGDESPCVTTNRLQIDNQSGVKNPFNGSSLRKVTELHRSKIHWRLYQGTIISRVPFKNKVTEGLRKS